MSQLPRHPLWNRDSSQIAPPISEETIHVNIERETLANQQLQGVFNIPAQQSYYSTNRQQAIRTLLEEEMSSCNELQKKIM